MSKFQRPNDLSFPQVYHTFTVKDRESDELVEYKIQDLLEDDYGRAVDLMIRDFASEESLCLCRGICDYPSAVKEIRGFWLEGLKLKLSVGCYKNDGSDDLAGVTILAVHEKNFEESAMCFATEHIKDVFGALFFIETQYDVFSKYGVDKYLTDYGMVTNKDYRNRGIGTEFLKARVQILKSLNISVTSSAFTVIGSQKAAIKANYDEGHSIKWTQVQKQFPKFDFSIANVDECKILDLKI